MKFSLFVLTLALAGAARADLTQSPLLQAGFYLNLDTGKTTGTPAANDVYDIRWTQSTIVPQGTAKAASLGTMTVNQFTNLTAADVTAATANATTKPLPAASVVANDVFVVVTNAGNVSKVQVSRIVSGTIFLTFTTYTAGSVNAPVIKQVLNNSSRIGPNLPNSGIAPSSLFVIIGTGLADPGDPVLQSSADPGLPLTLNGASISVNVNGIIVHPHIYYTSPTQIAAVLPANTTQGPGTVTVTYNGVASSPAPITVVPSAVGLNTYGTNTGVATDAVTGAVLTFTNSGTPGETIVLWATGLGQDPSDSDFVYTSTPHAVSIDLKIYIGGIPATILYQGASVYPGVNQINIVIPDKVVSGCWVSLVAVTGNVLSNTATLPINPGGGACVDSETGLDGTMFRPGVPTSFRTGLVGVLLSNQPDGKGGRTIDYESSGAFVKYSGIAYDPVNSVSAGGCIMLQTVTPILTVGLDAGSLTLTGPNGLDVTLALQFGIKGIFNAQLPAGSIPPTGGVFTFKGSGGADIGSFTSTINVANPLLTWTNPDAAATVDERNGLLITWTGGTPGSFVYIGGACVQRINQAPVSTDYLCKAHVEDGQFTVPSYILRGMIQGAGDTSVQNSIWAPLTATGIDIGTAGATVFYSVISNYTVPSAR